MFSEEKKRQIYINSLLQNTGSSFEEDYRLFSKRFDKICSVFEKSGDTKRADRLFGKQTTPIYLLLPFLPLFKALCVEISHEDFCDSQLLCDNCLSGFRQVFLNSLAEIFGSVAFETVEEIAGVMPACSNEWLNDKVIPAVENGSVFYAMSEKYPIFARQATEFVFLQAGHIKELLEAVTQELPCLWNMFFKDGLTAAKQISATESDRHNGGRSVHIIEFEGGKKLVYKPHSLAADRAFGKWINGCAAIAGIAPFRTAKSADTKQGAFCEFIEASPVETKEDIARFFEREGFLLGLVYMLRGNDLHFENIIACGRDPVIIDTETMLDPPETLYNRLQKKRRRYSVNAMGILPSLLSLPGLCESKYAGICNVRVGCTNLPLFEGRAVGAQEYAKEFCLGFEKAVKTVLDNLPAVSQLLTDCFAGCKIRLVIKATATYVRLLSGLGSKKCLEDKTRYKELLERLRLMLGKNVTPADRELVAQTEEIALARLDVPYFEELLTEEMLKFLADEWKNISKQDIDRETAKIKFCLNAPAPDAGSSKALDIKEDTAFDIAKLKEFADYVAKILKGDFISLAVAKGQDKFIMAERLKGVLCLLEAKLGACVALSAYLKISEDKEIKELVQQELKQLTDRLRSAPALTAGELGLADGAAGFLLGSLLCYQMGTVEEADFSQIVEMATETKNKTKLAFGSSVPLYGKYDMLYALSKLPGKFMTRKVQNYKEVLTEVISEEKKGSCNEEQLILQIAGEIVKTGDKTVLNPVCNHSLRFGNAGLLYKYSQKKCSKTVSKEGQQAAEKLCAALLTVRHTAEDIKFPEGCVETGFFHGISGVLYSVCRYLKPKEVPEI